MRLRLNLPKISFLCAVAGIGALTLGEAAGCGGGSSTTEASGSGGGSATSTTGTHMSSTSTSGTGGKASSTSSTSASTTSTGGSTTSTGGSGAGTGGSTTSTGGSSAATGGSTTSTGGSAATSSTAATSSSSSGTPVGCGNGTVDPGEECDDGNVYDLDGCDSTCHYEVVTRMSALAIATTTAPAFCKHTGNALGHKALNSTAVSLALNPALKTDVGNGTVNVLTEFLNLTDPTGKNASGFSIGIVDGSPDPAKGTFPTTNPTDWWFLADPTVVNMGTPKGQLGNGAVANKALTAGPSTVSLTISLGGTPADLTMNNAMIAGTVVDGTPTTPGDLPPNLQLESGLSVLTGITANGANQGLCGDVTVGSLKAIAVPSILAKGGMYACTEGFTTANSMLDVLVVGCHATNIPLLGTLQAVNPTQPDVAGNGKTPVTLKAGTGNVVTLPAGDTDAYSAFLEFATTREHFSGQSCTSASDCQAPPAPATAQACTNKVCTPQ